MGMLLRRHEDVVIKTDVAKTDVAEVTTEAAPQKKPRKKTTKK